MPLKRAPIISRLTPGFVKTLARLTGDEALAVATIGTEEGTFIIGQDAAVPIWKGLDLEDGSANDVIEQRVNTLLEGLFAFYYAFWRRAFCQGC